MKYDEQIDNARSRDGNRRPVGNGARKPACKRVRTFAEAMKAKEIVELPNGWKITPPSMNDGFPSIDIGHPIPDEAYD